MNDWISKLWNFARGAWRELPLEAVSVAAAALSSIAIIHRGPDDDWIALALAYVILGALLVTPLFFAATLLERRGRISRRAQLAGGALLATGVLTALVLALPTVEDIGAAAFAWPYGLSLFAAVLTPFVVVALGAGRDGRLSHFTGFVRTFFEQTTTWGLLWLGGIAALMVIAMALHELFDLPVDELAGDAVLIMTAGFVLTYLHRLLPRPDGDASRARLPELWRRLVTTIGAPFVSVMLVILVVYEIVVLARGELPRNLLSPLIMAAGFVGFFCTLVIMSILRQDAGSRVLAPADPHRWAKSRSIRLVRAFPVILLALLPMAAWALGVRIEQYGFTPFRVARLMALLCLGILSLLGTIRWLRGRMALTWEVPACVIGVALATAFGPTSAINLSVDSQVERLEEQLAEAGIEQRTVAPLPSKIGDRDSRPGDLQVTHELDSGSYWELEEQIGAVVRIGGKDALGRIFAGDLEACADEWNATLCLRQLGVHRRDEVLRPEYDTVEIRGTFSTERGEVEFFQLSEHAEHQSSDFRLRLAPRAILLFRGQNPVARASLDALLEDWEKNHTLHPQVIELKTDQGIVIGQIAVGSVELSRKPGEQTEVSNLAGVWLRPLRPSVR